MTSSSTWRRWGTPRVAGALGFVYALRLVSAWLLARPFVETVSASGVLNFPTGDAKLFEPGSAYLLEVLVQQRAALSAAAPSTLGLLGVSCLAALVPEYYLLLALTVRASGCTRPARGIARLAVLSLVTWATRAVFALLTLTLAMTARGWFGAARDERLPDLSFAVVVCGGALLQLGISLLRDVAYAAVVARSLNGPAAAIHAVDSGRRHAAPLLFSYAWTSLAALGVAVACAALLSRLESALPGHAVVGLALHQLTLGLGLGLRSVWLCRAVEAVEAPRRDEAEDQGTQAEAFL